MWEESLDWWGRVSGLGGEGGVSGEVPCWRRERDFAQLLQVSMDLVDRSVGIVSAV